MAKRKLTRRQAWRIEKIQEERRQRLQRKQQQTDDALDHSRLGSEQEGLITANFGASVEVEDSQGQRVRCHLRQNMALPVVGDRVVWQAGNDDIGVVGAVLPRQTTLARPDTNGIMKPIAANIDRMLVVTAPVPAFDPANVDPFLVAAEKSAIDAVLVFNKIDLLHAEHLPLFEEQLATYRQIGYPVIMASTRTSEGLEELRRSLAGHTAIFVGQSGVGKSSLIQRLLPEEELAVGEVAESGLGRHTTSVARLYHLPEGGHLVDSPGVREYRLWTMSEQELAGGFREFQPHLGHCRFRDCHHLSEPGCALLEAMESGNISEERLDSFHRIAASMEERPELY